MDHIISFLFVHLEAVHDSFRIKGRIDSHGKPRAGNDLFHPFFVAFRQILHFDRQPGRRNHAQRHAFAMRQRVTGGGLQGMTQRVAEIQDSSQPLLPLIHLDDRFLDPAAGFDQSRQPLRIPVPDRFHILFQTLKQFFIVNDAVLDDFGQTVGEFPLRQRIKKPQIRKHRPRLIKSPEQVLPLRKIHRCFPADGAVHLTDQRRRNLNIRDRPHIDRRDKARQVAHHAAAQRDQQRPPVGARFQKTSGEIHRGRNRLGSFSRRNFQKEGVQSCAGHGFQQRFPIQAIHMMVCNDSIARSLVVFREQQNHPVQNIPSDANFMGRLGFFIQMNFQHFHIHSSASAAHGFLKGPHVVH